MGNINKRFGFCFLIFWLFRLPAACQTRRCKIGFLCLLTNVPIGFAGISICSYFATVTEDSRFFILAGLIYAFSWLLLLIGVILTGRPLAKAISKNTRKKFAVWKKLRQNSATEK